MKIYFPCENLLTKRKSFTGLLFAKELCRCDSFAVPRPNIGWCLEGGINLPTDTLRLFTRNSTTGHVPTERNPLHSFLGLSGYHQRQHTQRTICKAHCMSSRGITVEHLPPSWSVSCGKSVYVFLETSLLWEL